MMRARPFFRLMISPQAGFLVLPLMLAAAWPLVRDFAAGARAGAHSSDPAAMLWGESVIFAVTAGFLSGLLTRDVLQAPFAFIVPAFTRQIFLGKAVLAIAIALTLGVALYRVSSIAHGIAIIASTLLFFGIGASLSDPVFPKSAVWAMGPLLVIPVWEPGYVQRFFESAPLIASVAAITAAAVLAKRELDPDTARQRTLGKSKGAQIFGLTSAMNAIRSLTSNARTWAGRPGTGQLSEWVKAVHHENFGVNRMAWPTTVLWAVGLNCGMAYFLKNPSFAAVMGLMNLSIGGHRITGRWAYPIARNRRALVLWICSLGDNVAYFMLALVALPFIYALDLPQIDIMTGGTARYGLLAPLGMAFIVAPVVQWPRLTSSLPPPKLMRFGPLWLSVSFRNVGAILIMTFMLETLFVVSEQLSMTAAVAAAVGLGLSFQYYYFVNLRHHFSKSDLA